MVLWIYQYCSFRPKVRLWNWGWWWWKFRVMTFAINFRKILRCWYAGIKYFLKSYHHLFLKPYYFVYRLKIYPQYLEYLQYYENDLVITLHLLLIQNYLFHIFNFQSLYLLQHQFYQLFYILLFIIFGVFIILLMDVMYKLLKLKLKLK